VRSNNVNNTVDTLNNPKFKWFAYTGLPYGVTQQIGNLPPTGGRSTTPRGAFKASVFAGGQINLVPSLVKDFGYLLLATMGKDAVTTGYRFGKKSESYTDTVKVGSNIHTFTFNTSETDIPYFTTRKLMEGPQSLGEITQDNRITSLELTIPNNGPMSASVEMMGRVPSDLVMFMDNPATNWNTAAATYDSDNAFGLSTDPESRVQLAGYDLYCTGLTVTVTNTLLQPQQGQPIGALTPVDLPVLSRGVTLRAQVMVTDWNLYRKLYTGAVTGTTFSSATLLGGIDFRAYAPELYATDVQRAFQVRTPNNNIAWLLPAPPAINPQQPMMLTLVGTVQNPTSGVYIELRLQNADALAYVPYTLSGTVANVTFTTGTKVISGTGMPVFAANDKFIVRGSLSNDGVYTATGTPTATSITVLEALTTEAGSANVSVTLAS
jgi:hypothetical protein